MRALRARLVREDGITMVFAVATVALLGVIATTTISMLTDERTRTTQSTLSDGAYQAAEAGIDDYAAKLLEDNAYYLHYRHRYEATRQGTDGTTVAPGGAWTGTSACTGLAAPWSYPNGKDTWSDPASPLIPGYQYDLEVLPPCAGGAGATTIRSTGRPDCTPADPTLCTDTRNWRAIEVQLRPSALTDFQMFSAADISYGSTATTDGLVYAGLDPVNPSIKHSIQHNGIARGNLMAEGSVTGTYTLQNGAKVYNSTNIRTVMKNPPSFSDFLPALGDVKRAAQSGGLYLSDSTAGAWQITFLPDGNMTYARCTLSGGQDPAAAAPSCGAAVTVPVPSNGAVYAEQTTIVSGTVNGRVTVVSANNIVVSNNITYAQSGDDVLGLIGANNVYVAHWAPATLTWRAATLAENGQWRAWDTGGTPSKGWSSSMTFIGSTATRNGGSMAGEYGNRLYQYDDSLRYLSAPWFPSLPNSMTVLYSREIAP